MKNTMEYKKYTGSVELSEKDGIFFGKVQGMRVDLSYEGTTVKELVKAFHNVVDEYLHECEVKRIAPETTYNGHFNVRIHPEHHRLAAKCAMQENITLNQFVDEAVKKAILEYVKGLKEQKK